MFYFMVFKGTQNDIDQFYASPLSLAHLLFFPSPAFSPGFKCSTRALQQQCDEGVPGSGFPPLWCAFMLAASGPPASWVTAKPLPSKPVFLVLGCLRTLLPMAVTLLRGFCRGRELGLSKDIICLEWSLTTKPQNLRLTPKCPVSNSVFFLVVWVEKNTGVL